MLKEHAFTVEKYNQVHPPVEGFDLVVLSGSSIFSATENPENFSNEIKIIKEAKTPIVGICLGCELISYVYGAVLKRLPEREHGITKIKTLKNNFVHEGDEFSAYEAHEWAIKKLSNKLMGFAKSKDGYEIIKVKDKKIYGLQFHPEMLRGKIGGYEIFLRIVNLVIK